MDAFSDSGELYAIRFQFYTHQHNKVKAYSLDEFSPENQLKVFEFQIRSTIALEQDASQMIEDGKLKFPGNEELFQLLQAWNDLKDFGTDDSTYFEDLKVAKFELQAILTSLYLIKFEKDSDQSINFLTLYIDNMKSPQKLNEIEVFLVLIQLYFVTGNFKAATSIFRTLNSFPDFARDNIIYQIIESWYKSIKNGNENITNAYYFYDEILNNNYNDEDYRGKVENLNRLLVLTLQLKHIPEAQEILKQIQSIIEENKEISEDTISSGAGTTMSVQKGDMIANQIALDRLVNFGKETSTLLEQLRKVNREHELLKDEEKKNEIFDKIVAKYQTV
ncbi:hypothetical protein KGF56_003060 [Candida oxycetoniae]|uniref:Coatomer subunit epsilon n=1 Tax=Candida oxycetoniae TaxID=497107 RepID=A0AAI9SX41_9ASCO|nr:uncharacterized protein KGF56_003060 [Candida oxycetoniae]KAI3404160.2 hypothetical protein KGF56_003060 [Candida oxycetoniae]